MKYFSMFSGIGGFEYGIEQAYNNRGLLQGPSTENNRGLPNTKGRQAGAMCVSYSEIDKYASAVYRYHYPRSRNLGDATAINVSDLPDFDLLVGGFPCQSFSIAGKRKGFNDTRGTLFFEIARILKHKRPRHFVLENVKGLLSHDDGKTFATILGVLSDIGYEYQWQVLNSKDFGVPQNRERVFIIGNLAGERRPEVFPIGESIAEDNELQGQNLTANTIRARQDNQTGGSYVVEREQLPQTNIIHNVYGGFNEDKPREFHDICPTIRTPKGGGHKRVISGQSIRRLTPIECERLQAFPDNWTAHGIMDGKQVEIPDTQRYKCCGNAVTTSVITAIIKKLNL